MTEFVVLIPARLDSSRLPGKALADIHGKPMVVRVAEQAAKSKAARVVVATDHPDIQTACQAHGIEVVMTSNQHESGTTRLAEAANTLKLPQHLIVVNVQGDEPLIDPELINRTAEVLVENNVQMATAAHELHDFDEFMILTCQSRPRQKPQRHLFQPRPDSLSARCDACRKTRIAFRNSRPAPHRHLRLPRRLPATLRRNERLAAGNHRIAGTVARPVARLSDCC